MDIETIREYCLAKKGVTEDFPFDEYTLAFRVKEKIFCLCNLSGDPHFVNLKCDPERAVELRAQYPSVQPGYHMSKRHWNSVYLNGHYRPEELFEWVDQSYRLVAKGLKKADRLELGIE